MSTRETPRATTSFCPFTRGKEGALERYRAMPEAAASALLLEAVAMAMNPRMTLYAHASLWSLLLQDRNTQAFLALFRRVNAMPWAVYRVRRLYRAKGRADRSLEVLGEGDRVGATRTLTAMAHARGAALEDGLTPRFYLRRREEGVYPSAEEMVVAAPKAAAAKAKKNFARDWARTAMPVVA